MQCDIYSILLFLLNYKEKNNYLCNFYKDFFIIINNFLTFGKLPV